MELERSRGLRSAVRGEEGVEGREREPEKTKAKFGVHARSSPLYSCLLSLVFPSLGMRMVCSYMAMYVCLCMPLWVWSCMCGHLCLCPSMSVCVWTCMVMYVWTSVYAHLCLYGAWTCMGHVCVDICVCSCMTMVARFSPAGASCGSHFW